MLPSELKGAEGRLRFYSGFASILADKELILFTERQMADALESAMEAAASQVKTKRTGLIAQRAREWYEKIKQLRGET